MPQPTSSLATLRPDLAGSFTEFDLEMNINGMIGYRVLPVSPVARKSGNFGIIPIEQLLQNPETVRAPGAGYGRGNWKFEPGTYACVENGWEEPVDDNEAAAYMEYFDAEQVSAMRARHIVLNSAERRVAAAIFSTSNFTKTDVTNEWDDADNATPIDDVEACIQRIWAASGLYPNTMIINRTVFRNLRQCDQIISRIQSGGTGDSTKTSEINVNQLAQCFDIPNILVAGGAKNTANEGQTLSLSHIWSDEYCWIGRTAVSNDFREPCVGRTFHWAADGSMPNGIVESYRDETVRSEIIRCRHDVDEKLTLTACGQLLGNITT